MHQLLLARRRQAVIFESAIPILGRLPLGDDPALPLHAMQRRIRRVMLRLQYVVGGALNMFRDWMPVSRAKEQGAQNQHIQCALQ
jgi:hypothetical protein